MEQKQHSAAVQQEPEMAIGEFGAAPAAVIGNGPMLAAPFYWQWLTNQRRRR